MPLPRSTNQPTISNPDRPRARASAAPAIVALLLAALAAPVEAGLLEVGSRIRGHVDVTGIEEAGDRLGATLAVGDFDGDGRADLAIGAPGEDVGSVVDAGAVFVIFGSRAGLGWSSRVPQVIHQDVTDVNDSAETSDGFGAALAVGDFNGDGRDDLAVGVGGENIGDLLDTGVVQLFYGSASGLNLANDALFGGAAFSAGDNDEFGAALVACDRNGDGRDDLVIGAPGWSSAEPDAGRIVTLFGTASGLTSTGATSIQPPDVNLDDRFGSSLACGNLDGDASGDLLVGAPFADDSGGGLDEGVVWTILDSGAPTAEGGWESNGEAGASVALARFGVSGLDSPVYGIPAAGFGGETQSGVVIDGSIRTQEQVPYSDDVKPFDRFGEVLAVGDFDGDSIEDLVHGVPSENLLDHLADSSLWMLDAGIVHVDQNETGSSWTLPAPADCSLVAVADRGKPLENAQFGRAVAAGDFDGNGWLDLAAGAPNASCNFATSGLVRIVYGWPPGWIFGDRFERGNTTAWSSDAP